MSESSVKILLIESDSQAAGLIADLLAKAKRIRFAVDRVDSLSQGLSRLKSGGIQTILIDISKSDCDAATAVAQIREVAPDAAVIVLCDWSDEALAARAVAGGRRTTWSRTN